ncbi:MAG TPA: hypothetical protein VIL68_05950 [Propionibacteriaceae bacterium]
MADNRVAEAVDIVARWALAHDIEWADYPEICERDFDAILVQAALIVACPSVDEYEAAYDFLAARAEGGEATR